MTKGRRPSQREIMSAATCRCAVTLIEVLLVLGVIGLLAALIVPAVQVVRSTSLRLRCQHQQRQVALALQNYHEQHNSLPPVSVSGGAHGCPGARGIGFVFPQLELGSACDLIESGIDRVAMVLCPSDGELDHVSRPSS